MRLKIGLAFAILGTIACLLPYALQKTARSITMGSVTDRERLADASSAELSPDSRPPKLSDRSQPSPRDLVRARLKESVLPVVDFNQALPAECIDWIMHRVNFPEDGQADRLQIAYRWVDAAEDGGLESAKPTPLIHLQRSNIDAWTLINLVADQANLQFAIDDQGVLEFSR
ncbi:hypothetical protein HAHE_22990 [Haloferula helveola]|uniref:Uncharacterized protein n=1 Tax=Haloferula helveola TaxID=490095 RepID=A0ABM7RML2_9BACT|nr:hypothetical protein HAHE_22990 [Haloferula helveola]